jgi:hypothetical protein
MSYKGIGFFATYLLIMILFQSCEANNNARRAAREASSAESEVRMLKSEISSLQSDIRSLESTVRLQRPICHCE